MLTLAPWPRQKRMWQEKQVEIPKIAPNPIIKGVNYNNVLKLTLEGT